DVDDAVGRAQGTVRIETRQVLHLDRNGRLAAEKRARLGKCAVALAKYEADFVRVVGGVDDIELAVAVEVCHGESRAAALGAQRFGERDAVAGAETYVGLSLDRAGVDEVGDSIAI